MENLFSCWQEFRQGKGGKPDVLAFERYLEDNVFDLHTDLSVGTYRHLPYKTFHINDPKHRIISKAAVRDRLVHHAVFNQLYRIFDRTFIFHSYSSRLGKGTHLAVGNLARSLRQVSRNYTHPAFVLKCDIRKFFQSVSHQKLLQIIQNKIKDSQFLWLIEEVVKSFFSPVDNPQQRERELRGIPPGNLTSQIFANMYLNELDQFVKHKLRVKHYFRYADDFVIVHFDPVHLKAILRRLNEYLGANLLLELHPSKVTIRKLWQGIDFLGYAILPYHIVLRTKTRARMFRKLFEKQKFFDAGILDKYGLNQSVQLYLGMLKHCNGYELSRTLRNNFLPRNGS